MPPSRVRTPSQLAAAPTRAVDDGGVKAAAPRPRNNRGDEADVTAPHPAPRGPKPPPMFVQDKIGGPSCAEGARKRHATSQARNSAQGLKLRPTTRRPRPLFKIRSVCPLRRQSGAARKRALPGQCHNCQSYGHSSRHCYHSARCVKCLGDHGTAQCTRIGHRRSSACVLCKQKGHTANWMPACSKETLHPRRPCRRAPRLHSVMPRAAAGPRNAPPAAKSLKHPLTI
ncbi:Nucleic-acid-binding protein from transposon X-element [Eumeta japonica]|uniref:Nucleic-acid-binding protein from transposon X-element n=1 Tax=Eumeta variegata TaxID=151549 RepID=A0A4C1T0N0_EUMVA|nr:Nucleic-acid-binding protein from transposon X-element [Eumeta japonica]